MLLDPLDVQLIAVPAVLAEQVMLPGDAPSPLNVMPPPALAEPFRVKAAATEFCAPNDSTAGSVVLSLGTPPALVIRTALFTGETNPVVFAAD
jgi:hypothetical protein